MKWSPFLCKCFCAFMALQAISVRARPGDLDVFFGSTNGLSVPGTVLTPFSATSVASVRALAVQSDGKIIAVGSSGGHVALVRYQADGRLDAAFGIAGRVETTLSGSVIVADAALQADGKIVVAASNWTERAGVVFRYQGDGSLDQSFGENGMARLQSWEGAGFASSIAVLGNGKLLIAGITPPYGGAYPPGTQLWRLHPDGSPDISFGTAGNVSLQGESCQDMAVQPDEKILVAGATSVGGTQRIWLARWNSNGVLDTTFGNGGTVAAAPVPSARSQSAALALQSDGKIIVAGYAVFDEVRFDMLVARFLADGSPDISFNGTGVVIKDLPPTPPPAAGFDSAYAVVAGNDGKLLVAGTSSNRFALLRFLPDGRMDDDFGTDGMVLTRVQSGECAINALVLQADGKILAGGRANSTMALARYIVRDIPENFSVERSGGAVLQYGETVGFEAAVRPHLQPRETTLILRNTSNLRLSGISARLTGTDSGHFEVTAPATEFGADATTVLTVKFIPPGITSRVRAALVIECTDPVRTAHSVWVEGQTEDPVATMKILEGGVSVARDSTLDFGSAAPSPGVTKLLTVQNTGNIDLIVQGLSISPAGASGDFTAGEPETRVLAGNQSTTFPVTFTPSGPGNRTARLRIASTDTFNPPFEITLTGRLATAMETWRFGHFGSTASEGPSADLSDPDNDGIPNLLEYATLTNPLKPDGGAGRLLLNGNTLEYTINRPSATIRELAYIAEWSTTPDEGWRSDEVTATILSDDGEQQEVRFSFPGGDAARRFVRLRVTRK